MISPVSRNMPRNIIPAFTLIAVWDRSLYPLLNDLPLPERCILLLAVTPSCFIEVMTVQDGYAMPDFDLRSMEVRNVTPCYTGFAWS